MQGSLPGRAAGGIVGLLFFPSLYLVMLVPLLFPDGRFMSRRWAAVAALLLLVRGRDARRQPSSGPVPSRACRASTTRSACRPGRAPAGADRPRRHRRAPRASRPAIVAAILRYRRGTPVERKQLKWFGSVLVLAFSMFFAATVCRSRTDRGVDRREPLDRPHPDRDRDRDPPLPAVRDRPDREPHARRTRSSTALLAAAFVGTNLALQAVLVDATGGGTRSTMAASTLVVAALFQPVRRRDPAADRPALQPGAASTRSGSSRRCRATVRDEVDLGPPARTVVATVVRGGPPGGRRPLAAEIGRMTAIDGRCRARSASLGRLVLVALLVAAWSSP